MSLLTSIDNYVMKGNAKLASGLKEGDEKPATLHEASPLITAARELNPLVNGAVPDYKATAIVLARTVLNKHALSGQMIDANAALQKAHSNQLKNVMLLVGVVQALRPVVCYVRANPLLWAFVPRALKGPIDTVLAMILPGDGPVDASLRTIGLDVIDGYKNAASALQNPTQTAGSTRIGRDA